VYEAYEHDAVRTSEEAAKVRNSPLSAGAKALLLYGDDKPLMLTVPGDRKVDMKKVKHDLGIKDLRMATPDEVEKVTGVTIGAVPPFGSLFGIPLYMDAALRNEKEIFFNAGSHTKSIKVGQVAYEQTLKPIVGEFSLPAHG
jgi:Ala-tRNA(Pro) deacylase